MIDCHCHLYPPAFPSIASELPILQQSKVHRVVCVAEDCTSAHKVIEQAQLFPHALGVGLGLHPVQPQNAESSPANTGTSAVMNPACNPMMGSCHLENCGISEGIFLLVNFLVKSTHGQAHDRAVHASSEGYCAAVPQDSGALGIAAHGSTTAAHGSTTAAAAAASSSSGAAGVRSALLTDLPPMLELIREYSSAPWLVCVGEVGLDFAPHVLRGLSSLAEEDQKQQQREVLRQQSLLAQELHLPVNVHSRSAGHHAIQLLVESGTRHALLHAFDGRPVHALRAVQEGYYLSVPPSVVRSPGFQKMVECVRVPWHCHHDTMSERASRKWGQLNDELVHEVVPLDHLVLESDAPALAPVKGEVNHPANVGVSAAEIARSKGVTLDDVVRMTTDNAFRLFPKLRL